MVAYSLVTFIRISAKFLNRQALQMARIISQDLDPILDDYHCIRMAKTSQFRYIQSRFNRENHTGLDYGLVSQIQKGSFMIAQANGVSDMVFPIGHQVLGLVISPDRPVNIRAFHAWANRCESRVLQSDHSVEHTLLLRCC